MSGPGTHGWGPEGIAGGRETAWVVAGIWVGAETQEGAKMGRQADGWANGPPGEWVLHGWARGSGWLGKRGWVNRRVRW